MVVSKGTSAAIIALVVIVVAILGYKMFLQPNSARPSDQVKQQYLQHGLGPGGNSSAGTRPAGMMSGGMSSGGMSSGGMSSGGMSSGGR
jgi:hypothetical protein